jgi:hypothetical protein
VVHSPGPPTSPHPALGEVALLILGVVNTEGLYVSFVASHSLELGLVAVVVFDLFAREFDPFDEIVEAEQCGPLSRSSDFAPSGAAEGSAPAATVANQLNSFGSGWSSS